MNRAARADILAREARRPCPCFAAPSPKGEGLGPRVSRLAKLKDLCNCTPAKRSHEEIRLVGSGRMPGAGCPCPVPGAGTILFRRQYRSALGTAAFGRLISQRLCPFGWWTLVSPAV